MKRFVKNRVILLTVLVTLMILSACWGDPELPISVENKTDMVLAVYSQRIYDGEVKPGETMRIRNISGASSYIFIEAKNDEGNIIYSRNYTVFELEELNWKVVIP